jgi:hypothetical protein
VFADLIDPNIKYFQINCRLKMPFIKDHGRQYDIVVLGATGKFLLPIEPLSKTLAEI